MYVLLYKFSLAEKKGVVAKISSVALDAVCYLGS